MNVELKEYIKVCNERDDALLKFDQCVGINARVIEKLKEDLEIARMQLAACGVAAMQNTRKTVKDRITKDHPYWSASYGDVCSAVDREMEYRERLEVWET